jgi:hypothetical protein
MACRLVDVVSKTGGVLHTYPVTLSDSEPAPGDGDYIAKALEAAAHGRLVPDCDLDGLTARMHVSRGGRMQPYGDEVETSSQTKAGLEDEIRERAYLLWEESGCPEGKADEFWHQALDQHLRGRAYVLWEQKGHPQGADDDWHQVREFQSN